MGIFSGLTKSTEHPSTQNGAVSMTFCGCPCNKSNTIWIQEVDAPNPDSGTPMVKIPRTLMDLLCGSK